MNDHIIDEVVERAVLIRRALPRSITVLLVEDSTVLTQRVRESLAEYPQFDIIGAVDTEADALRTLARCQVDLVLLDLHLKQGSGFGVMRALAGHSRSPHIIVLTNHNLPEYITAALDWGVVAFLDKATHFSALPRILTEKMVALGVIDTHGPVYETVGSRAGSVSRSFEGKIQPPRLPVTQEKL